MENGDEDGNGEGGVDGDGGRCVDLAGWEEEWEGVGEWGEEQEKEGKGVGGEGVPGGEGGVGMLEGRGLLCEGWLLEVGGT